MHFDLGLEVCLSLCWVLLAVWSWCLDSLVARGSWEVQVKAWGFLCPISCLLPRLLLSHLLLALRSSSPHWRLQSKLGKCIVMKLKTREKRIWSKAKQTKADRKKIALKTHFLRSNSWSHCQGGKVSGSRCSWKLTGVGSLGCYNVCLNY